jgi:hypothetical protein
VVELAFRCLAPEKEGRPNMKESVVELKQIKQITQGCTWRTYNGYTYFTPELHVGWIEETYLTVGETRRYCSLEVDLPHEEVMK